MAHAKIKRNRIKQDIVQFAIPGLLVLLTELVFLIKDGLSDFWQQVGQYIIHPSTLADQSAVKLLGLIMFFVGFSIMITGQVTLDKNYSGTVVIRENHKLVTHGIYSYIRNPMYFGGIIALPGLAAFAESLNGFLISLLFIPIVLNRIRLEEQILTEEFQDDYLQYKREAKRIIPIVF